MSVTNTVYMSYIQSCAKFWNDPAYSSLKKELISTLYPYQFLGICAVMWRFVTPTQRRVGITDIATLARKTVNILKS